MIAALPLWLRLVLFGVLSVGLLTLLGTFAAAMIEEALRWIVRTVQDERSKAAKENR